MQLELLNLLENFKEVLEQDVRLLAIKDVMIAHYGSRLHAKLRLGQDKLSLAILSIVRNRGA